MGMLRMLCGDIEPRHGQLRPPGGKPVQLDLDGGDALIRKRPADRRKPAVYAQSGHVAGTGDAGGLRQVRVPIRHRPPGRRRRDDDRCGHLPRLAAAIGRLHAHETRALR
jgi:hypothetical protein